MLPEGPSRRGSVLRALLWFVSVAMLLGTAALVLLDRMIRREYEPELSRMREEATRNVDFFCEQQVLLAQDPWFHEPRTEGDAGPLLNAWLPWGTRAAMPAGSPLAVPSRLPDARAQFTDWLTSDLDVSSLDFGWMRRLHAYDRWDTFQNTPVALPTPISWTVAPQPDFPWLRLWSKFRLLHGLRTGQPVEAARDVRQLAWLLYRTDTVLGPYFASSLLEFEREAHDSLKTPPPQWQPMSREQLARLLALARASTALSSIASPPEVARKSRHCGTPPVMGCTALAEASILLRYLQPVAQDLYPEAYAAHAEDLASLSCATSAPRILWERGATVDDDAPGMGMQPRWLDFAPASYARRFRAGNLITVGAPGLDPLRQFRSKLESGAFQPDPP